MACCGNKKTSSAKTAAKSNANAHRPLSYNKNINLFGKPAIRSSITFAPRNR